MSRGPDRRRVVAIGALLGVIALVFGTLAVAGSGGGSSSTAGSSTTTSSSSSTTTTTIDPNTLPPGAKEMYFLVQKGSQAVFHAVFAASSPQYASASAVATMEEWRKPGKAHLDLLVSSPDGDQKTSGYALPSGTVQCQYIQDKPLCQLAGNAFVDEAQRFIATIAGQLVSTDVVPSDEAVGPYPARCFTIGDAGKLCLAPDTGALLLLQTGDLTYQATLLDTEVSDKDFVPPGTVLDRGGNPVNVPGQPPTTAN